MWNNNHVQPRPVYLPLCVFISFQLSCINWSSWSDRACQDLNTSLQLLAGWFPRRAEPLVTDTFYLEFKKNLSLYSSGRGVTSACRWRSAENICLLCFAVVSFNMWVKARHRPGLWYQSFMCDGLACVWNLKQGTKPEVQRPRYLV